MIVAVRNIFNNSIGGWLNFSKIYEAFDVVFDFEVIFLVDLLNKNQHTGIRSQSGFEFTFAVDGSSVGQAEGKLAAMLLQVLFEVLTLGAVFVFLFILHRLEGTGARSVASESQIYETSIQIQSSKQSINQSIDQSTNRPINQSTNRPIN